MAISNPGLGEELEAALTNVRAKEAASGDNTIEAATLKAVVSYALLVLLNMLWRPDGTSALDYEDEDLSSEETALKQQLCSLLRQFMMLLGREPVRQWEEVATLAAILEKLDSAAGDADWEPRVFRVGTDLGIAVERQRADLGTAIFTTPEGAVTAHVYKARHPDVPLHGIWCYLVQQIRFNEPGQVMKDAQPARYVVAVDDPYWGLRIQPGTFSEAPMNETFVMGYRVSGRILNDGNAVENANVSLEGVTVDGSGVRGIFHDSLEYNELAWSASLETWVEGPLVRAPICTDEDGRFSIILPCGDGAIYQRDGDLADDSEETQYRGPTRRLESLHAVYRGRRAELGEGHEAVINICSGRLKVIGEPGAWVNVGTLDNAGEAYLIGPEGTVELQGLAEGETAVVHYRRNAHGQWDPVYGTRRTLVETVPGELVEADMGTLESYNPAGTVVAGRIWHRAGVPAAGVAVVAINWETEEVVGAVAVTDANGYWDAVIPPEGFGGDLWIHDAQHGSIPVISFPYSDIVIGARAYASPLEIFKPQAWRKGDRGHANFQYVQGSVKVEDIATGVMFETDEAAFGGWQTVQALPKYRYVDDVGSLLQHGPQLCQYRIWCGEEVVQDSFTLGSQSFEDYETLPGTFRAGGYSPEYVFLMGGRVHGSVLWGNKERTGVKQPEASRIGLEFGRHEYHLEVGLETGENLHAVTWTDLSCPYCGGPLWRDPDERVFSRGHCVPCALAFGRPDATNGRSHFCSSPVASNDGYVMHSGFTVRGAGVVRQRYHFHWRPDLYAENGVFLTQSGPGTATNAPRWFARHVDEMGDGKGFGGFDGDLPEVFVPGHGLEYYEALPEIDRPLGLCQLKCSFPAGYVQPEDVTVEIDCLRADGSTETVPVTLPAGTRGPCAFEPFGDVVHLNPANRLHAENTTTPYLGSGLYRGITDVRLKEPSQAPGSRFTVVNDGPFLSKTTGTPVEERTATPAALQAGEITQEAFVLDDAVGQVFMVTVRHGDLFLHKRNGLPHPWEPPRQLTGNGLNHSPQLAKDDRGTLLLCWHGGGSIRSAVSRNDGNDFTEV